MLLDLASGWHGFLSVETWPKKPSTLSQLLLLFVECQRGVKRPLPPQSLLRQLKPQSSWLFGTLPLAFHFQLSGVCAKISMNKIHRVQMVHKIIVYLFIILEKC